MRPCNLNGSWCLGYMSKLSFYQGVSIQIHEMFFIFFFWDDILRLLRNLHVLVVFWEQVGWRQRWVCVILIIIAGLGIVVLSAGLAPSEVVWILSVVHLGALHEEGRGVLHRLPPLLFRIGLGTLFLGLTHIWLDCVVGVLLKGSVLLGVGALLNILLGGLDVGIPIGLHCLWVLVLLNGSHCPLRLEGGPRSWQHLIF